MTAFRIGDFAGYVGAPPRAPAPVWTVARIDQRRSAHVARRLLRLGAESFEVWHTERVRCGPLRRLESRRFPTFPGWLFVDMGSGRWREARAIDGVLGFAMHGGAVAVIGGALISALRVEMATREQRIAARARIAPGDAVRIAAGPLCGMEGVVASAMPNGDAVVMLSRMGRLVIDLDSLDLSSGGE